MTVEARDRIPYPPVRGRTSAVEALAEAPSRGQIRYHNTAQALNVVDFATVLMILDRNGPSTHHEISLAYTALVRHPRMTPEWLAAATVHLARAGHVEPDPIAGRGERGRKARRWRIARPLARDTTRRPLTGADAIDRLLAALPSIEPETGYLRVDQSPSIEEDFSEKPAVAIDGWVYRDDLDRVMGELLVEVRA